MTASAALLARSWPVGSRMVTLTLPKPEAGKPFMATVEWAPNEPSRLTDAEWRQYRQGRHQAISDLAEQLGVTVALVEL